MESDLTELEIDAVIQLIQLSGTCDDDLQLFWVNFPAEKEGKTAEEEEQEGGSAGQALSSSLINQENKWSESEEALPRRKVKYGSLVGIYRKTQPLINTNRPKKRPRF